MSPAAITCTECGTAGQAQAVFCRKCGTRLPPSAHAARGRLRVLKSWRGRLAVAVVVAFALAADAAVWTRHATGGQPDGPVRAWFAALAARDTAAAATVRPGLEVLRDNVLHSPVYTPPAGLQIVHTAYAPSRDPQQRPNHDIAFVTVRYQIAEDRFEQTIAVNRTGSGLNRSWILGDGATGSLTIIGGTLHNAVIGPITVPTAASADGVVADATLMLPPGQWTVYGDPADPLFTARPVTATVPGRMREQSPTMATLAPTVKPAATAAVSKLVHARIDDCAARQTLSMVDCPFDRTAGPYTGTVTSVHWTIRRYPTIALTPVEAPYPGGPIATLSTTTPGVARVAYAAYTTGGKTVTEDQTFAVDGDIRIDNGSPVWTGGKSGRLI
jgi:hypothetical protein